MSDWIDVIATVDLEPGHSHAVYIEDISILVCNIDGNFYAIQNLCTHDGGDLGGGPLIGDEVVCPRHGARFCVKNGAATRPPAYEDVITFPVRVEKGMVQVRDDRWD